MFTELKKGKWNYLFLTAIASLALAALATLITSHSYNDVSKSANYDSETTTTGRYTQFNESTTMRFIN